MKRILNATALFGLAGVGRLIRLRGIPVLHYHGVNGENQASVTREHFVRQMRHLSHRGYTVLSLSEVVDFISGKEMPPRKSLALTFDDCCRSMFEYAFPVLAEMRFPATVFLTTGRVGKTVDWETQHDWFGLPLVSWSEAREMACHNIDFGAHTHTHPRLTALTVEEVRSEVNRSRMILEDSLGREARLFAYPYGDYNNKVVRIIEESGFAAAFTTAPGLNAVGADPFTLKRSGVFRDTTLAGFQTRVRGTFSWYYYGKKRLRATGG